MNYDIPTWVLTGCALVVLYRFGLLAEEVAGRLGEARWLIAGAGTLGLLAGTVSAVLHVPYLVALSVLCISAVTTVPILNSLDTRRDTPEG